ncbi:MAG TPA: hypothetical protein VFG34_03335 [Sphingopyxis sp.]|nr:hypothetical protein [Sphingopyxis sp.]
MKNKMMLMALGASLIAIPAMAMPGDSKRDPNAEWTRAQAQEQAVQMFARMDINQDGKLDAADRAAQRSQRQDARFAALDANKDGSISKAEWDQHESARQAKAQERRAERAAKRAAAPAAAAATGEPAMRGYSGRKASHHRGMMRGGEHRGGAMGNAAVTQAEFVAKALARFDAMDANKDGKVTRDEREAARAEMRSKRAEQRAIKATPLRPATPAT